MFVQYEHHGRMVWARSDLKGQHRTNCLCYSCERFKPNSRNNCRIAKELYALNVKENLVTPVYECPVFEVIKIQVPESAKGALEPTVDA